MVPASSASTSRSVAPQSAPLDSSVAAPSGTWADLAMGRLDQLTATFWQLFVLESSTSRWSLVTPPGVADNGGLVSSAAKGTPLVAGFETSLKLGFSPLATTTSEGKSWQPGVLPSGLAHVPDAIATSGRNVLALLGSGNGSVVTAGAALSSWTTVATERALASSAAAASCKLTRLTAVAYSTAGEPIVGGQCRASGTIGLFERVGTTWKLLPAKPPGNTDGATTVLRASSADGELDALVATDSGSRTELVGVASGTGASRASVSRPLELPRGARLDSTGMGPSDSLFVLFGTGRSERAELLSAPGGSWHTLPAPPTGTATLALANGGRVDALAVTSSVMTDYVLNAKDRAWKRSQQIDVPIQYGSSG